MNQTVNLELTGEKMPMWANESAWYYENEHNEQWIAKLDGQTLIIAGSDIDWEEIKFTKEQVISERERLQPGEAQLNFKKEMFAILEGAATTEEELWEVITTLSEKHPLFNWNLEQGEILWILSVFSSALPKMECEYAG